MLQLGLSFTATPLLESGSAPPDAPGNDRWEFDDTLLIGMPSADGWAFLDTILTEMENAS